MVGSIEGSLPAATIPPEPIYQKRTDEQRLLAIAALEDKIIQGAAVLVLNAIYEGRLLSDSPMGSGLEEVHTMRWTPFR